MKLKNILNNEVVAVRATTDTSASSYGQKVWIDAKNNSYCQVGLETEAGYTLINEREELGCLLAEIRTKKGVSKYSIEKSTFITKPSLIGIERGSIAYTVDTLIQYLESVGIDLNALISEKTK